MASLDQLRSAILSLLGKPIVQSILQLNNNHRDRAFEAYIFALVIQAVQNAGGRAEILGIRTGRNPNPIVFRGGPGHLSSRLQNFCYASCQLNDKEFELHLDIEYEGTSGATHEIDISIIDHSAADRIRQNSGQLPSTRNLRGAFECKFYDSDLGTALGRAFVGLISDCGKLIIKIFVSNGRSEGLASYFSISSRPDPSFFVSPLFCDHSSRFVSFLEQELRKWAKG